MHAAELFQRFREKVIAAPDVYLKDYQIVKEQVRDSTAWYKGEPVKFLYQPMFFDSGDIQRFRALTQTLTGILRKVIDEYIRNPKFRRLFDFPPLMEELILVDPGYDLYFPMARFDIFYPYSDGFKFCELNADGSSSMNEARELHRILGGSKALTGIKDQFSLYDFELFDTWIDCVIENYKQYNGGVDDRPTIAIMDFEGEGIISEFKVFRERFVRRGYETVICDPRELKYRNGRLYIGDTPIKLIYRRATTVRLVDEAEHIEDFLKAYRDGAVCVVGGLVSQVIHNKRIFAVLHQVDKLPFLDPSEVEFIKRHIPYTALIDQSDVRILSEVVANKDQWVLKPLDQFAGHGVHIGRDYSQDKWEELVSKAACQPYLVQELCHIPQLPMLTIEGNRLFFEPYNYLIGLFVYNEKFSGIYTRAGRKSVIASIAESFTLPNFILKEKNSSKEKTS